MILENKTILLISPEAWGQNFVSKHHYALELSKFNMVYFLNPPSSGFSVKKINPNLIILDYKNILRGTNMLPAFLRDLLYSSTLQRIKKNLGNVDFDIIWSFDPYRFQNLSLFNTSLNIYHPVDVHYTRLEKEIAKNADIIFTTCELISKKLQGHNLNIHNIGHALSEGFLNVTLNHGNGSKRIKVCMMGNLQRRVDYPILLSIVQDHPELDFHFIGPIEPSNLSGETLFSEEIGRLRSYVNTNIHGSIPHNDIPEHLSQMDVFLIMYREDENPAARANPHKMLEYLSIGKVVVASYTEEYETRTELIEMVRNNKDFQATFHKVINNLAHYNSEEKVSERRKYASINSYKNKISRIGQLLEMIS